MIDANLVHEAYGKAHNYSDYVRKKLTDHYIILFDGWGIV